MTIGHSAIRTCSQLLTHRQGTRQDSLGGVSDLEVGGLSSQSGGRSKSIGTGVENRAQDASQKISGSMCDGYTGVRIDQNNDDGKESGDGKSPPTVDSLLQSLDSPVKLILLIFLVLLFFGIHNFLQEKIYSFEGFVYGWALGLLEVVGVCVGSLLERYSEGETFKRVAPFRLYILLACCLGVSSSLSNIALNYINYPTKVIFRSCKLIPTMLIAVVWRRQIISSGEFVAALAVCMGLIVFAEADMAMAPDFDPRGIGMVMLSVCADAVLPNLQEHVFVLGATRSEVTFFCNALTFVGMTFSLGASGDLVGVARFVASNRIVAVYLLVYTMMSHLAISAHMMVVKEFGGITAVLVGNTRKAMTIALSFILFPKPFSMSYAFGAFLVLGGLVANVLIKENKKKYRARKEQSLKKTPEVSLYRAQSGPLSFPVSSCTSPGKEGKHPPSSQCSTATSIITPPHCVANRHPMVNSSELWEGER